MTVNACNEDGESYYNHTCEGICQDGTECDRGVTGRDTYGNVEDNYCHDHEWQAVFTGCNYLSRNLLDKGSVEIEVQKVESQITEFGEVYKIETQYGPAKIAPEKYEAEIVEGGVYDFDYYTDPHDFHSVKWRVSVVEQGTNLDELPGLSEFKADALVDAGFATTESIVDADTDELAEVEGISTQLAMRIQSAV